MKRSTECWHKIDNRPLEQNNNIQTDFTDV